MVGGFNETHCKERSVGIKLFKEREATLRTWLTRPLKEMASERKNSNMSLKETKKIATKWLSMPKKHTFIN